MNGNYTAGVHSAAANAHESARQELVAALDLHGSTEWVDALAYAERAARLYEANRRSSRKWYEANRDRARETNKAAARRYRDKKKAALGTPT